MRFLSLLLGLVPLVGLAELGLHQFFATRAPQQSDYAALGPELIKLKQTGVPVVVAPHWAEPLVRQAAPPAFPAAELTRPDDTAFPAFLEVSLLGQSAPELAGFMLERTQNIGKFRLSWRRNPRPTPVLFDFVSAVDLGEVEVFTELEGERRPCPRGVRTRTATGGLHGHVAYPRQRFDCSSSRLVAVTLIDDQQYRSRRCVLTQLPESGSVVLRFNSVPASKRLVGFTGFSYFLERDVENAQVELSVSELGQALGQKRAAGAEGWSRFELARSAAPGSVEVSVRRLASESRDFCFALEAR
jgi:hypothetical protein